MSTLTGIEDVREVLQDGSFGDISRAGGRPAAVVPPQAARLRFGLARQPSQHARRARWAAGGLRRQHAFSPRGGLAGTYGLATSGGFSRTGLGSEFTIAVRPKECDDAPPARRSMRRVRWRHVAMTSLTRRPANTWEAGGLGSLGARALSLTSPEWCRPQGDHRIDDETLVARTRDQRGHPLPHAEHTLESRGDEHVSFDTAPARRHRGERTGQSCRHA